MSKTEKINVSKEKEIDLINYLLSNDSYLAQEFTEDDLKSMILNIKNDLPVFLNTTVGDKINGYDILKSNNTELTEQLLSVSDQLHKITGNAKRVATQLLDADPNSPLAYNLLSAEEILIIKIKYELKLNDSERDLILEKLKHKI